ncbi:hypothetical protein NDU88_001305 [Pleurodeles waltl]|uniref:Uncharacterized protein n=1 Tax=Pleurodeles waltl TaxID=8319 RepID=A0AAV7NAD3_PLEWA|nr:hypothetical protein NDU88_001305 [Pleurodeles waltl]
MKGQQVSGADSISDESAVSWSCRDEADMGKAIDVGRRSGEPKSHSSCNGNLQAPKSVLAFPSLLSGSGALSVAQRPP